jgi:D-aminoacyl-tRNA deacylase
MRALVQRVTRASVSVEGETVASIGAGLLVLLGVTHEDEVTTADRLAAKVVALRIFEDSTGRMSEALGERQVLCVSQFTLYADTKRGNRPSFAGAAAADHAWRCMSVSALIRVASVGSLAPTWRSSWSTTGPSLCC